MGSAVTASEPERGLKVSRSRVPLETLYRFSCCHAHVRILVKELDVVMCFDPECDMLIINTPVICRQDHTGERFLEGTLFFIDFCTR
jgi:hypothetical protein